MTKKSAGTQKRDAQARGTKASRRREGWGKSKEWPFDESTEKQSWREGKESASLMKNPYEHWVGTKTLGLRPTSAMNLRADREKTLCFQTSNSDLLIEMGQEFLLWLRG